MCSRSCTYVARVEANLYTFWEPGRAVHHLNHRAVFRPPSILFVVCVYLCSTVHGCEGIYEGRRIISGVFLYHFPSYSFKAGVVQRTKSCFTDWPVTSQHQSISTFPVLRYQGCTATSAFLCGHGS